jgi:hypothetical protein
MIGKERQSFATGAYAYGQVERALGAALYADTATQQGSLRGRLKRLSTLGLPASGPGKGSRRLYSLEEAHQLLVALLMEDAGLDPVVVAPAVEKAWMNNLAKNAATATSEEAKTKNPIIIKMALQTVTGPWRTGDANTAVHFVRLVPRSNRRAVKRYLEMKTKPPITPEQAEQLADEVAGGIGFDSWREEDGWFVVRNYTTKAEKLEDALKGK